jgi:hypothetical protein
MQVAARMSPVERCMTWLQMREHEVWIHRGAAR